MRELNQEKTENNVDEKEKDISTSEVVEKKDVNVEELAIEKINELEKIVENSGELTDAEKSRIQNIDLGKYDKDYKEAVIKETNSKIQNIENKKKLAARTAIALVTLIALSGQAEAVTPSTGTGKDIAKTTLFDKIFKKKDSCNNKESSENKKSKKIVHFDEFLKQLKCGRGDLSSGPLYEYFMGADPINDKNINYGQELYFKPHKEIIDQYKKRIDTQGNEYWDRVETSLLEKIEKNDRAIENEPLPEDQRGWLRKGGQFVTTLSKPDKSIIDLYTYHPGSNDKSGNSGVSHLEYWVPKKDITYGDQSRINQQNNIVWTKKFMPPPAEIKRMKEEQAAENLQNQVFKFNNPNLNPFIQDFMEKYGYYKTDVGNEGQSVWQKDGADIPIEILMREFERAYAASPSPETLAKTEEDKVAMSGLRKQNIDKIDKSKYTDEELTQAIENIDRTAKTDIKEIQAFPVVRNETDTDNSFETMKWMYDWLKHPESIKRARNLGLTEEELTHALNRLAMPLSYEVDPSIAFDKNGDPNGVGGTTDLFGNIKVVKDNDLATIAHELGHRAWVGGENDKIRDILQKNILNNPEYLGYLNSMPMFVPNDNPYAEDKYKYMPEEIYSRIWQMRKKYNLKPGQKVLPSMIKDYNPKDYFGMDEKKMIYLLNLMIKNDSRPKATIPYEDAQVDLLASNQLKYEKEQNDLNKAVNDSMRDFNDRNNSSNNLKS